METVSDSVGAYEAKTHLPRLLKEVQKGRTITITKHGVPVARLVPASNQRRMTVDEAIDALIELRKGVTLGGLTIRDMVEEGRRY
jgi:prevent-host-death family protein